MADGVLTGSAVTFVWRDPGTIGAASPTQIELEYVPTTIIHNRTAQGGTPGAYVISPTVTGGTITGTSFDTSTIRIEGRVERQE